jgi:IclR family transcriptional regulator, acetate operon repressor
MVATAKSAKAPLAASSNDESAATEGDSVVRRVLAVLSAFTYAEPVLGVSELARRLALPKTTVHRLLTTLVEEGFVERTSAGRYRLSLRVYEIGQQAVQSNRVRQAGHAPLERLRNDTQETVHLAVLAGTDVLYVDRFESPHLVKMLARVGRRNHAHATSSGKCLLAFGTMHDVKLVIDAGLPRLATRTATTPAALRRALSETRKRGYAVSIHESANDVVSVAAPIFDRTGACAAAVSVAGPVLRLRPDNLEPTVRLVVRCAAEISKALALEPTW